MSYCVYFDYYDLTCSSNKEEKLDGGKRQRIVSEVVSVTLNPLRVNSFKTPVTLILRHAQVSGGFIGSRISANLLHFAPDNLSNNISSIRIHLREKLRASSGT